MQRQMAANWFLFCRNGLLDLATKAEQASITEPTTWCRLNRDPRNSVFTG
jgi:hypothetical protein